MTTLQTGTVAKMFITVDDEIPQEEIAQAYANPQCGLPGDKYSASGLNPGEVFLVAQEETEEDKENRGNIITKGVNLKRLVENNFGIGIGGATFRGLEFFQGKLRAKGSTGSGSVATISLLLQSFARALYYYTV